MKRRCRNALIAMSIALLSTLVLTGCSLLAGDSGEVARESATAGGGADAFPGVLLEDPQPAPGFTLTGHDGEPMSLSDVNGGVVAIFFGYTGCPDVCPLTLGYMAQATEALGDDAGEVQYLLITVDPERDDPQRLSQYVSRIDAPITALTGDLAELEPVWDDYDIVVERQERDDGGYLVDHSAQIWLIDPSGELLMFLPMGADGEELTAAIRWLLDRKG